MEKTKNKTTAELTETYLSEHPSIKDCLSKGIINYSKLSRLISEDLNLDKKTSSMDAILVSCRRYSVKLKNRKSLEYKIMKLLKDSQLEIRNKIVVLILSKSYIENMIKLEERIRQKSDIFYLLEGTDVFTLITSEKYMDEINKTLGKAVIKTSKDLAMITIKTSEDIEITPGVTSFITSLFSDKGINLLEVISCWTDTIFVISDENVPKAISLLKF